MEESTLSVLQDQITDTLRFFDYAHLPIRLIHVSQPFHDLAHNMVTESKINFQLAKALEKLLEAKDCAVRASL